MAARPICKASGKRMLARKEAMREARWWRKYRYANMSHYRCNRCNMWHVGNQRAG